MANWYKYTVPKCKPNRISDEVLTTVNNGKRSFVVMAIYCPYHHCTFEDIGWSVPDDIRGDLEYIEKEDTWWIPEGWYEVNIYTEECYYSSITDNVIAWAKLPKPYKPRVKNFSKEDTKC